MIYGLIVFGTLNFLGLSIMLWDWCRQKEKDRKALYYFALTFFLTLAIGVFIFYRGQL